METPKKASNSKPTLEDLKNLPQLKSSPALQKNVNQVGKPISGHEPCLEWVEIEYQGKISARYGHSAVAFQDNYIYIFGGDRKDSKRSCSMHRYCLGGFF